MAESEATDVLNTGSQLYTNYSYDKIFIGCNTFENADLTASGSDVTVEMGTLMGRIHATGKIIPLVAAATDGSQYPLGITAAKYEVLDGATQTMSLCVSGEVEETLITLNGAETLDTVVSGRRLRDRIASDTLGIKLRNSTEMTVADNS